MLDQLFSTIGGDVVSSLTEKAGITSDQAQQVLPIAQESLQDGLMKEVTGGNISGILGMFNGGESALGGNPIFDGIKQTMMANVMTKMGLPQPVAALVAGSGMTSVVGKLGGLLGGDDGQVSEDSLMSKLNLGGGTDGLMDAAKNIAQDKLGGTLGNIAGGLFGK